MISGNTLLTPGGLTVDARDFGARGDGVSNDAPAVQDAIDGAADLLAGARGSFSKASVVLPRTNAFYRFDRSVHLDRHMVELTSDGATVQMNGYARHAPFILGLRRQGEVAFRDDHAPHADGVYDNSVTSPKRAVRLAGDSHLQFQANGFQWGQIGTPPPGTNYGWKYYGYWADMPDFTLDLMVGFPGNKPVPGTPLVGLGVADFQPSPWYLVVSDDPTRLYFTFKTSDMSRDFNQGRRIVGIPIGTLDGPLRLKVQVQFDLAGFNAYVNGAEVPISFYDQVKPGGKPWQKGLRFLANDSAPLMVGCDGVAGGQWGSYPDFTVYGLKVSRAPGDPNASDFAKYFEVDDDTVALLPLEDPPARAVTVRHGKAGGYFDGSGYRITKGWTTWVQGSAIRNLAVVGGDVGVAVGVALNPELDRVVTSSQYQGVGSIPGMATYTVRVDRCKLGGWDCAYFGANQEIAVSGTDLTNGGLEYVRLRGCSSNWDGGVVAEASAVMRNVFYYQAGEYGGGHRNANVLVDFEGQTVSEAVVCCENHASTPTTLIVDNLTVGSVGPDSDVIRLRDVAPISPPKYQRALFIGSLIIPFGDNYRSLVRTDGPAWGGKVSVFKASVNRPYVSHDPVWGPTSYVRVVDVPDPAQLNPGEKPRDPNEQAP